jgi:hypothetical protein
MFGLDSDIDDEYSRMAAHVEELHGLDEVDAEDLQASRNATERPARAGPSVALIGQVGLPGGRWHFPYNQRQRHI